MWGFFSAIFNKIASAAVAALVAVGLVSAPALPPPAEEQLTTVVQESQPEVIKEPEKKVVPTANVIDAFTPPPPKPAPPPSTPLPPPPPPAAPTPSSGYFTTPSGVTLDKFGNVVSSSGSVQPVPQASPSLPPAPPGTFRLPNGALVDANGNIIQSAPSSPSSSGNNVAGSVIQLPRSVSASVGFNPDVSCENLGFFGENLNLCKLYKEHKNEYTWNVVD